MLGISQRNGGNGFLKPTCRANLLSAVHHILQIWAAERLAATLPTHCCWKVDLDNCSLVCSSHVAQLRAQSLHCKKSWRPQLCDQTLCFCAETKGWAWCKHNAELVEPTVALRNLLLAGSGCLEIQKGVAGIDSLDKHVQQVSFRQWVTFWEHGQLKGWQPHFQPTVAKSSISTTVLWFAAVTKHNWEHNHCIVTNLGDHNCLTKRFASLHETGSFFCRYNEGMGMMQAQCRTGGAYCRSQEPASGRGWMLGIPKWNSRNGCLKQTCRVNLLSAVLQNCEDGQLKGWQPHFQPTDAKSSISTSVHWFAAVTKHNWEHNHCIVRNKSWRAQLRDQTLCFFAWDGCLFL